jgi:hypothetical protein
LVEDAPPARPPFTTTVINGPVNSTAAGQVLRVTYRDSASMEVVAVQEGRTSGDDGSLRFGAGGAGGVQDESQPRRFFAERDRSLRRLGAARAEETTGDQSQPGDMEEGE